MKPMRDAVAGLVARDATFSSHPLQSKEVVLASGRSCSSSGRSAAAASRPETVAVIARTNAPLVALLFSLMARGIPCEMLGKEPLATKLVKLIRMLKSQVRR